MTLDPTLDTCLMNGLIHRIRAGDRMATDEFLRRVCGRLERMTRRMLRRFPNVGDLVGADDVLQNALLRLLRSLETVSPTSTRHLTNLAAVHIRRELLDLSRHYRHRLDRPTGVAGTDESDLAVTVDDRASVVADLDDWAAFHVAVEKLPVREREVVGLTFYHGWSQIEIAELLQLSDRQGHSFFHLGVSGGFGYLGHLALALR